MEARRDRVARELGHVAADGRDRVRRAGRGERRGRRREPRREADGRTVWQGRRVQLGSAVSDALSPDGVSHGELDGWLSPKNLGQLIRRERKNFHLAIRIPRPIVRLFEKRKGLMGCNFSAPRAAVEAVNGYDASWEGARHLCEDLDLEIRLRRQGTPLTPPHVRLKVLRLQKPHVLHWRG